ncbi:MAG: hypothetical protein MUC56_12770 [Thermoanaerobaculales bacterium]|jgi:hypothetical protein|nr:hypothetical protein [Thermoanaerobaculales bacterium]
MTSTDLIRHATTGLLAVAAIALIGCSSAEPTDDPGVYKLGEFQRINRGPEAEVVVGYRYAQGNLGAEWLLLEIAATSPPGQTARIQRDKVSLRTPAGATLALASQQEFNEAYASLQAVERAADVVRDPMGYWPPRKEPCAIRFFTEPGRGVSFDEFTVNDFRACEGRFWFRVPGGVQAGRYVLEIDLEESEIRVPFTLASR